VPKDVYCRDAVVLGLWSGKWRVIGDMWEEGERRRLGPIASLSADDGRITEVFMLDGNDVFRSVELSFAFLAYNSLYTRSCLFYLLQLSS